MLEIRIKKISETFLHEELEPTYRVFVDFNFGTASFEASAEELAAAIRKVREKLIRAGFASRDV